MKVRSFAATIERQFVSRYRSLSFWTGAVAPVLFVGVLLYQTALATKSPSSTMILAVLSALWISGSGCVREIVDEREMVRREAHLSLLAFGIAKILHASALAIIQSGVLTAFLAATDVVRIPVPWLWVIVMLTGLCGGMLALLLSALSNAPATALAWFPLLLVPQVLFGGFLFYYAPATPFMISPASGQLVVTPPELERPTVKNAVLNAAGVLCISRWALEAFAATALEQDLKDARNFEDAIKVAGFIPLTLAAEPPSKTILKYMQEGGQANPAARLRIDAHGREYFVRLAAFALVQAVLLILILPVRDPRRLR